MLAIYLFADDYDIPQLRKDVLDTLVKGLDSLEDKYVPNITSILTTYESLSNNTPMKRWLVDRAARDWNTWNLLCEIATGAFVLQEPPQESLVKVLRRRNVTRIVSYPPMDPCDYHGYKCSEKEVTFNDYRWIDDL